MSWFTKILGIDAQRNAQKAAEEQRNAAAAEAAQARSDALAQSEATAQAQKEYQATLLNMQTNAQALQSANQASDGAGMQNIIAAGSATEAKRQRKTAAPSLAATLGINI